MIHAILLCRDARRDDSGYREDVYEEVDADTPPDLLARAAAQMPEDADASIAFLFVRHDTLTSKLPAAVDAHRRERSRLKKEAHERARQATRAATAKRRETARAAKAEALRKKMVSIESGEELQRLRRELAEVEAAAAEVAG